MGTATPYDNPVPIESNHDVAEFDCGAAALNDYLRKFAFPNQRKRPLERS